MFQHPNQNLLCLFRVITPAAVPLPAGNRFPAALPFFFPRASCCRAPAPGPAFRPGSGSLRPPPAQMLRPESPAALHPVSRAHSRPQASDGKINIVTEHDQVLRRDFIIGQELGKTESGVVHIRLRLDQEHFFPVPDPHPVQALESGPGHPDRKHVRQP